MDELVCRFDAVTGATTVPCAFGAEEVAPCAFGAEGVAVVP